MCSLSSGRQPDHQEEDPCARGARAAIQVQRGVPPEETQQRQAEGGGQGARRGHQHQEAASRSQAWVHGGGHHHRDGHPHPVRRRQRSQGWLLERLFPEPKLEPVLSIYACSECFGTE